MAKANLRIVYYFEPWTELGRPYLRYHNLRFQMGKQIEALRDRGCEVTVLMGENTFDKCRKEDFTIPGVEMKVIEERELRAIFPDYLTATTSLQRGTCSAEEASAMRTLVEGKLDGRVPDVFISFLSPAKFLQEAWADTLVLYTEFGIFSRFPYPRTFYFDAFGMFGDSYIRRFGKELKASKISPTRQQQLDSFRRSVRQNGIFDGSKDFRKEAKLGRFAHNILLPLQFSNYFGFDTCAPYRSQYEFLVDTLERTPENVGVIVTEHSTWGQVLTEHNVDYLQGKYPHLVIPTEMAKYSNYSQLLLDNVDAVASVSSSVGLQAAFWQKPVIAMGDSHLNTFSAGRPEEVLDIVQDFDPSRFDPAIAHLLERYYPADRYVYNADWVLDFLQDGLQKKRSGNMGFDFYRPIDERKVYQRLSSDGRGKELARQMQKEATSTRTGPAAPPEAEIMEGCDVVSFDIFDTLIQRPFDMPHKMFLFMQDEVRRLVGDPTFEFHKLRRLAEHRVRTETSKREVDAEDIYAYLCDEAGISQEFRQPLIDLEVAAELRFCEARPAGRRYFKAAQATGKKVILISDFHIGAGPVEQILKAAGYSGWDKLYVSCDYGMSKKDGSLFEHVLLENGIDAARMLHFGDNRKSDVVNANSFGISAVHLRKAGDLFFENRAIAATWQGEEKRTFYPTEALQKSTAAVLGLCANRLYGDLQGVNQNSIFSGSASDLGYCLFGPLFAGFALHLQDKAARRGVDNLVFLSRDGSLMKKVFDEINVGDRERVTTRYALSSRRALSVPAIMDEQGVLEALRVPYSPCSLGHLLQNKFGLSAEAVAGIDLAPYGFESLQDRVHPSHQMIAMRKLLKDHTHLVLENAAVERQAARAYYADFIRERTAIVDIGYSGSLQHYLQTISGHEVDGFYLMTHLKGKHFAEMGLSMDGFLGNFIDHTSPNSPFKDRISLFETICSSEERGLKRFIPNPDGTVSVEEQPEAQSTGRRRLVIADIQRGILEFVRDFRLHFFDQLDEVDLDRELISRWPLEFFKLPTPADARIFNNVEHEDLYGGHDSRYVLADVATRLLEKRALTADEARDLVARSDWAEGARAILPPRQGEKRLFTDGVSRLRLDVIGPRAKEVQVPMILPSLRGVTPPSGNIQAKVRKFVRDPRRFMIDFARKRIDL